MLPSAAPASTGRRRWLLEVCLVCRIRLLITFTVTAMVAMMLGLGCSVNVKKQNNGEDKQVDINTPVGGIHVSNEASAADVGLTVYPGARLKQKNSSNDDKSANVDISGFGYSLKVIAME